MSVAEPTEVSPPESTNRDRDAALAEAERRIEELGEELRAARQTQDEERELRETLNHAREGLRAELAAAQRRLDDESQAHAKTRGSCDQLQSRVSVLEGELAEARREASRQSQRAEQASRDLAECRRGLVHEQAAHRTAREALQALEAGKERGAQELAAAQAQAQRLEAEAVALRERLAAEQTTLLEIQERCEALKKEVDLTGERVAAAKRALTDETAAHAETRRRLEDAREAVHRSERKRQKQTIVSVLGGVAIGLAAVLRRRA